MRTDDQWLKAAKRIFKRLDRDIRDRGGIKHEWSRIDESVMKEELRPAWLAIFQEEIKLCVRAAERMKEPVREGERV